MLDNFVIDQTFTAVKTHQTAYSDGNYIWSTNAGSVTQKSGIYRYSMAGSLLTSHANATDSITGAESDVYQLNGMDLIDGKLYIGAMNYPHGSDWPAGDHNSGNLYQRSYITRWDAYTLAYEAKWAVGDSSVQGADSLAKWTEGCAYAHGFLFVCFHGDNVVERYTIDGSGDLVFQERHTMPSVDNGSSTYNAHGFEDITFAGEYAYLNRHAATLDPYFYMFRWTGTEFLFIRKFPRLGTDFTQGINIQPNTNILWACQRTTAGGQDEGDISKVYARGFDLYDNHNGVCTSDDNGVCFTNANGVIISK
jgi:hypothetical protein